jgi:hypothetical protein
MKSPICSGLISSRSGTITRWKRYDRTGPAATAPKRWRPACRRGG